MNLIGTDQEYINNIKSSNLTPPAKRLMLIMLLKNEQITFPSKLINLTLHELTEDLEIEYNREYKQKFSDNKSLFSMNKVLRCNMWLVISVAGY